jgi:hypothetical protein
VTMSANAARPVIDALTGYPRQTSTVECVTGPGPTTAVFDQITTATLSARHEDTVTLAPGLTITYASRPPLEPLPTVLAACQCRVWPVPAGMPYGRCGRCATGVRVVGPDPESPA